MPYNGTGKQTDKEFYEGVARLLDVTPQRAKKYWEDGFNEFIVRELFFKGICRLPNIGTFTVYKIEENVQYQEDENGKLIYYRVPERYIPKFTPHDIMINDINMNGVTKKYRKRLRENVLTERDYKRKLRAQALGVDEPMTEEHIEASKISFKEKLEKKKAEYADRGKSDEET